MALGLASGVAYAGVVVGLRRLRDLDPLWLSGFNNLAGALALAAWLVAMGAGLARRHRAGKHWPWRPSGSSRWRSPRPSCPWACATSPRPRPA